MNIYNTVSYTHLCRAAGDGPTERQGGRHEKEYTHRPGQVQRQVCVEQLAVLWGVRHRLPAVRVDPARDEAPRVAVRQPAGLWEEVLHPLPHLSLIHI